MSDTNNNTGNPPPSGAAVVAVPHHPFPAARLLFTIGYGFIAYFVLHVLFVLVAVQFVMFVINGRTNDELKSFSVSLVQYTGEILAYMVFARDAQPFPFGAAFPKSA
jgi:hypothetical protein